MDFQEKEPPQQFADGLIQRAIEHRYLICRGLASATLWWRRYGGGREVEGRALGLLMVWGWAFFTHDIICLAYAIATFVGMVAYALTTRRRNHSHWEGWPYLMAIVPHYRTAELLEILAVAAVGLFAPPLVGTLILASAAGLWINFVTDWWFRRKDVIAHQDARIDMTNRREAYRRGL